MDQRVFPTPWDVLRIGLAAKKRSQMLVSKRPVTQNEVGHFELLARTMPNVEYFDFLLLFQHPVDRTINRRIVTVQQMPELFVFGSYGAAVWVIFQAENSLF